MAPGDPIGHVVVLMLENRSFDQMLGDITRIHPEAEGIPRDGSLRDNRAPKGQILIQGPGARCAALKQRNPGHTHMEVMQQVGDAQAPMSGFISSYLTRYPDATLEELEQVMAYFPFGDTPELDALPVLHTLAREFAVCDHWFSSVPGPTWMNRFFALSGTSLGHVAMPTPEAPEEMHDYDQDTIFDRLSGAGVRWQVFHHGLPLTALHPRMLEHFLTFRGYSSMKTFHELAAGEAEAFPEFGFIEPAYFGQEANDQQAPCDVRRGEQLLAEVYQALRSNERLWRSTLLIVTYDEHGGYYDHVPPPATVAPDAHTAEWAFDRLGVRVPTLLISPWVERGVISTVFDHTSLLRYLCEKWNLAYLGERMAEEAGPLRSNTFGPELRKRSEPRQDTPERLRAPVLPQDAPLPQTHGNEGLAALNLYLHRLPSAAAKGNHGQ